MTDPQGSKFEVMAPGKWLAMHSKYAGDPDVLELLYSHDVYKNAFYAVDKWRRNFHEAADLRYLSADIQRGESRSFNSQTWETNR